MPSDETVANVALVTKTLVHNGAQAVHDRSRLTFPSFLDFSSLCTAAVVLDRLGVMASVDRLSDFPLIATLSEHGLLSEVHPRTDPAAIRRVVLRLPPRLANQIMSVGGGDDADPELDLREEDAVSAIGAVEPC